MTSAGAQNLVLLFLIEPCKLWRLATCVFAINLDQAGDEELLFLVRLRLPVVWLAERDNEAHVASPFLLIAVDLGPSKRFNVGEVVEVPRLADRKGAVRVLLGFVHADAAGFPNCDNDDTRFLGIGSARLGRRR